MNGISILNPLSNRYHALEDFSKLTLAQRIVTVVLTVIAAVATAFIATAAVFRTMVGHFVKVMHPVSGKEKEGLPAKAELPLIPKNTPVKKKNRTQPVNRGKDQTAVKEPSIKTDASRAGEPLSSNSTAPRATSLPKEPSAPVRSAPLETHAPAIERPVETPIVDLMGGTATSPVDLTPFAEEPVTPPVLAPFTSEGGEELPNFSLSLTQPLFVTDATEPTLTLPIEDGVKLPTSSLTLPEETFEPMPLIPFEDGVEISTPSLTLPEETYEPLPLIPFHIDENSLSSLDVEARKTHQLAPIALDPSGAVVRAVEMGLRQGVIDEVERYDVNHPLVIKRGDEVVSVTIVGSCIKAHMTKDGANRFAYLIAADLQLAHETRRLEIAFTTPKDARDTVAIGNLALQHMEKRGRFITGNMITDAREQDLTIFRPTSELSSGFMNRIEQLSMEVPSLRRPLSIEYRGQLPSKALEVEQQQEILGELEESIRVFAKEQAALEKARKAEDAYINLESEESEISNTDSQSASEEPLEGDGIDMSVSLLFQNDIKTPTSSLMDSFSLVSNDMMSSVIEKSKERKELGLEKKHCNIVSYIYHHMSDLVTEGENDAKKIQDSDAIAFKGGRIVKAESEADAKKSYREFFHILKESFGTLLARRVFGRYRLNKKDTVALSDLKKAMVGVASNVLECDLKSLFDHIKADMPGKLNSYRAGDYLYQMDQDLYMQIKLKETFNDLSTEEINFLHSAFRTVPVLNTAFSVSDVLGHLKKGANGAEFLFNHDLDALTLMESWNQLDLKNPDLALGEYAGKSLAYLELKPGQILPMPIVKEGVEEAPVLYKVAQSLVRKNDAVIAHILAPLNNNQAILPAEDGKKKEDVFLVFRGTLPDSGATAGGMSLYRDFHYDGIGRKSYDLREKEIQEMTEDYLKGTASDEVTLRISGHSLGACDTQRGLVSILEKIAASEEGSPWRKVKNVVVTTFNAPKVNQSVNHRMKEAVKKINGKGIDVNIDLKHVRFFDKSYEDTIQKFGDILLGADYHGGTGEEVFKNAPNVKRAIINMHMDDDQGFAAGFLVRHGYRPFNKALCQVPYEMKIRSTDATVSADPEKDRVDMEKEMAGTYYWNDNEMGTFGKIIGNVVWYTTWFGLRQPKKVVQAALVNAPHSVGLSLARLVNGSAYENLDEARNASL